MKKGGAFGLLALAIAMVIVLTLVARQWKSVAPMAIQLDGGPSAVGIETHGQDAAGRALQQGQLPDLNRMRQATDEHAQEVQQAFAEVE